MKQKKIFPILFVAMMLFVVTSTEVTAIGPKCVYGTVFVDGAIADVGVEVKIVINGGTFNTTTVDWNGANYIIGIPPGYEGETGYFYVTFNNLVPYDNQTILLSTKIGYVVDLHVNATVPNQPPNEPINPSPSDGATDVDIGASLGWFCDDPDGDPVTYDVYFGTTSSPPKVVSNQSSTTYYPGLMNYDTKYYWKVVAWDDHSTSNTGLEWDFTTKEEVNNPPVFLSETPFDSATSVPVSTSSLSVYIDDPEDDSFDWTIETSPNVGSNSGSGADGTKTCLISGLDYSTIYTWYVNATDPGGSGTYAREVYTFTCEDLRGDMNCDGSLSSADVRYLARHIVGDSAYSSLCDGGDVNCDGSLSSADVRYLARHIVGDSAFSPLYPTC